MGPRPRCGRSLHPGGGGPGIPPIAWTAAPGLSCSPALAPAMPAADRQELLLELGRRHDQLLDDLDALNERIEAALAANQSQRIGDSDGE